MNENLELNTQPSPEESERAELIASINNASSAEELANIVYNSGNTHLIRGYHETRLEFLHSVLPSLAEFVDVDEEGFLVKEKLDNLSAEEKANVERFHHISAQDTISADDSYLESARPELLDALTVSDYDNLPDAS
jgi:hypothetical protein